MSLSLAEAWRQLPSNEIGFPPMAESSDLPLIISLATCVDVVAIKMVEGTGGFRWRLKPPCT